MIVRMWMAPKVITIAPGAPIGEAAALMATHGIRRLPVVEPVPGGHGRLVGIVSHGDVLHAAPADVNPFSVSGPGALPTDVTVGHLMQTAVITTDPDAPIEQAADVMRHRKIGALPVVLNGHLMGMLTESDILRAFASLFAGPGDRARITFDVALGEDVFTLVSEIAQSRDVHVHGLTSSIIEGRPVYVLWVSGTGIHGLQQELWAGGHMVLSVLRV